MSKKGIQSRKIENLREKDLLTEMLHVAQKEA